MKARVKDIFAGIKVLGSGIRQFFTRWFLPLPAVDEMDEEMVERWEAAESRKPGQPEQARDDDPATIEEPPHPDQISADEPQPMQTPKPWQPDIQQPEGAETRSARGTGISNPFVDEESDDTKSAPE